MSIYARYKRDNDGFRKLVELLESTPLKRRQELIEAGMKEDPAYTKAAIECIMTFQDVLKLPEMELTEVISIMKPKNVAFAVSNIDANDRSRLLKCVPRSLELEVNSYIDMNPSPSDVGQARREAIMKARELEAKGLLSIKKIPKNISESEIKKSAKKNSGRTAKELFGDAKDLFGEGLFGEDSELGAELIGKKKAK